MFNSQTLKPFHWNDIFMLLSMDMTDPYLHLIEFPVQSVLKHIKPIARSFVISFNDVYPAIYVISAVNDAIIELFKDTFDKIEAKIGQKYFQSFYEWGDNLILHGTLSYSMDAIWRHVFIEFLDNKMSRNKIAGVSKEQLNQLKVLITKYRTDIFNVNMTFDAMDELEDKSEWDKKIYSIYRQEGKEEAENPDSSPLQTLWVMIYYVKIRAALLEIKDRFTLVELSLFDDWVASVMEKENITGKVQTLNEILNQLDIGR
jgi:hypothetical protein